MPGSPQNNNQQQQQKKNGEAFLFSFFYENSENPLKFNNNFTLKLFIYSFCIRNYLWEGALNVRPAHWLTNWKSNYYLESRIYY